MSDLPPPIMFRCRTEGWKPYCGKCGYCGKDLVDTGYACRKEKGKDAVCLPAYNENHYWGAARYAVLRRDNRTCVKCGWNSEWCSLFARLGFTSRGGPEVNHIIPRDGNTDDNSCYHHLDNLETLCHKCHVDVTAEQRGFKFKTVKMNGAWVRVRRE